MAYDKVVDSAALDGYFADIADAIRAKGGSGTYTPAQMPQAIEDLPASDTFGEVLRGEAKEIVFDFGSATELRFGTTVVFSEYANKDVKKITFVCGEGAQQRDSARPIATSSYSQGYALEEIDFGNLVKTYFGLGNLSGTPFPHLKRVKADHLKIAEGAWNYFLAGSGIETLRLPEYVCFQNGALRYCPSLELVDVGNSQVYRDSWTPTISSDVFSRDTSLVALVLRATAFVYQLSSTSAFTGTPIASGAGYIYVPRAMISTYEAATNWSTYAGQFRAIEDYTDDGTVDGEFIRP